ncbi:MULTISPECIES: hypothetical protein [Geomicrobium]|uniref:Fatty acid desaturase n=1 Tax=Geomicrobium sediminis TaxID=1347788 RepID=A0ABS2P9V2_9BACL|nr:MULTISPECIES: hypothetical protein [Geomicrobium]MBM7632084.1 fatty acid desaturase [Geomicrobium sediminis]GAK08805.1 hypothetical protein JCM19038_2601 [Geomicrobium sp. JCM 19038]
MVRFYLSSFFVYLLIVILLVAFGAPWFVAVGFLFLAGLQLFHFFDYRKQQSKASKSR